MFLIPKKTHHKALPYSIKKESRIEIKKAVPKGIVKRESTEVTQKPSIAKLKAIPVIPKKEAPKKKRGEIAIVIDDWGYSANHLDILAEIKLPLTLAILPFRDYSQKIAEFGHQHNFEIIIHMPMEPEEQERVGLEPATLMTAMSSKIIIRILNDAFDNIPYAVGANNHMGSLATQDEEFITTVFKELKKKNFYFLDSLSTYKSVCYRISKKIGIRFVMRSVFLDNYSDLGYIKDQLMQLARKADRGGKAIGIGHDRKNTLEVLREIMPELEREGYEFVFASELAE